MAESTAIPESPRKARFPMCFNGQHESFTHIMTEVLQVIETSPNHKQKELSAFIQRALYSGMPEETVPAISSSPRDLIDHVKQYCNPLNMELLKILVKSLKVDELTGQFEECEHTLSAQLQSAVWDTEVDVAPPPAYRVMLVKTGQGGSTTVREAVEVRKFLAEHLMFKGQQGILCLAGLANDTLVFYISKGSIGPMVQRMQHEKKKVYAQGVEKVTFVGLVSLDIKSGQITPHPDVPTIDPAAECPEFGVLLIGVTGTGKSTLINNLLGAEVAREGHECTAETERIRKHRGTAAGVPVILYDTPGTNALTTPPERDVCREIKTLIQSKKIHLTIFCFSMKEGRIQQSHISTMRAYHKATVNWDRTIVALTFADMVTPLAPRQERRREGFNEAEYFRRKINEWEKELRDALVKKVGVQRPVAECLCMHPTTDDPKSPLPDLEEWFIPLWLDILDSLEPAAYLRFVEIHRGNITLEDDSNLSLEIDNDKSYIEHGGKENIHLAGENRDRFQRIADNKLSHTGLGVGLILLVYYYYLTWPRIYPISEVIKSLTLPKQ